MKRPRTDEPGVHVRGEESSLVTVGVPVSVSHVPADGLVSSLLCTVGAGRPAKVPLYSAGLSARFFKHSGEPFLIVPPELGCDRRIWVLVAGATDFYSAVLTLQLGVTDEGAEVVVRSVTKHSVTTEVAPDWLRDQPAPGVCLPVFPTSAFALDNDEKCFVSPRLNAGQRLLILLKDRTVASGVIVSVQLQTDASIRISTVDVKTRRAARVREESS